MREVRPFIDLISDSTAEGDGKFFHLKGNLGKKMVRIVRTPEGGKQEISPLIKSSLSAISAGICGGLVPHLKTGDVVLSTEVFYSEEKDPDSILDRAKPALQMLETGTGSRVYNKLKKELKNEPFSINTGPTVTLGFALPDKKRKKVINRITGALSVDMEDFHRLSAAREQGTPFLSVRAVFDELDDEILPWKGRIPPSHKEKLTRAVESLTVVLKSIIEGSEFI
jgi:nucleoside phosphorylase